MLISGRRRTDLRGGGQETRPQGSDDQTKGRPLGLPAPLRVAE